MNLHMNWIPNTVFGPLQWWHPTSNEKYLCTAFSIYLKEKRLLYEPMCYQHHEAWHVMSREFWLIVVSFVESWKCFPKIEKKEQNIFSNASKRVLGAWWFGLLAYGFVSLFLWVCWLVMIVFKRFSLYEVFLYVGKICDVWMQHGTKKWVCSGLLVFEKGNWGDVLRVSINNIFLNSFCFFF